ncbi:uncharacterized protein LOC129770448 [Toxorhynchites rutilus septentrionalis]|uniref:uncharacterized protein LOC129770448 n=1 Tax=Toxorhynchites rutilus septentrionalis TaxID=329112 RepID=UPI00247A7D19|nr:uncharacterized protein LOC129770448 [Toxorhynchites rutilus septentrionalis]
MVYSNYNNSFLPLDGVQSVTFYKNENLLFPTPPASATVTAQTTTGNNASFGDQQQLPHPGSGNDVVRDFQPVTYLSSNGYYGYIPASSMPKMMSTETKTVNGVRHASASNDSRGGSAVGIGVLLDCHPQPAAAIVDDCSMMDCGVSEMENYHHQPQQQQILRKRKERGEEALAMMAGSNCKRRKTWQEQQQHQQHQQQACNRELNGNLNWNQASAIHQMQCNDQTMETIPNESFNGASVHPLSGFYHHPQQQQQQQQQIQYIAPLQTPAVLQPKNQLGPSGRCLRWNGTSPTVGDGNNSTTNSSLGFEQTEKSQFGAGSCQELEDLFISLHGSGFFLSG